MADRWDMTRWFKTAKPASFKRNYAKTLSQTLVFWGFFLIVLPAAVSAIEDRLDLPTFSPQRPASVVLFCLFGALGLSSGYTMSKVGEGTPLPTDAPRRLVVVGPYRHVRNPMAIAGLTQGVATGLWFGSPLVFAYIVAGGLLWNVAIRPPEEADLRDRFGNDFDEYCSQIRCWIPRVAPFKG